MIICLSVPNSVETNSLFFVGMSACTDACLCSREGSERSRKEEASDEDEDTEYFDAMEDSPAFITVTASESTQHRSVSH